MTLVTLSDSDISASHPRGFYLLAQNMGKTLVADAAESQVPGQVQQVGLSLHPSSSQAQGWPWMGFGIPPNPTIPRFSTPPSCWWAELGCTAPDRQWRMFGGCQDQDQQHRGITDFFSGNLFLGNSFLL